MDELERQLQWLLNEVDSFPRCKVKVDTSQYGHEGVTELTAKKFREIYAKKKSITYVCIKLGLPLYIGQGILSGEILPYAGGMLSPKVGLRPDFIANPSVPYEEFVKWYMRFLIQYLDEDQLEIFCSVNGIEVTEIIILTEGVKFSEYRKFQHYVKHREFLLSKAD